MIYHHLSFLIKHENSENGKSYEFLRKFIATFIHLLNFNITARFMHNLLYCKITIVIFLKINIYKKRRRRKRCRTLILILLIINF